MKTKPSIFTQNLDFGKIFFTVFATLLLSVTLGAQTTGVQVLRRHLPVDLSRLTTMGQLPGTNHLNLAIGLPLRNRAELSKLLQEIYDPTSPNFHHYLTPEEFTKRFGPTESDYQAVIAFAKANSFRVTATPSNRLLLDVNGTVANIERALHVTIRTYRHPTENRTFYAPDTDPSLDLAIPILHISGLNNYSLPRPQFVAEPLINGQNAMPNLGSGPGGAYMGKDFRAAYVPDSTLNGSGQSVGLLQFDGYTAGDITYYENMAGLPNITLSNVLIDGASGLPSGTGGEVEVSLDIEMAISMATNLSEVVVYMAPNPSPFEDILNRMVTDNLAKQLSCSWYIPNGVADTNADQIFQEMAVQGQSFLSASGDNDAYNGLINFPGDTPYVTEVGGTTLTTTYPGGAYVSETVWNSGNGLGSGGGISTQYPIPDWQTNISMTANQGSTTMRNVPDVAMTADNVYVRADGYNYRVVGTSCAAPLWAGFIALVNQQAVATGRPTVGFINPLVDVIGTGPGYTSDFHDIMTGNNTSGSSPNKFYAVTGYDLCTGWGTPSGQKLISALANPEPLVITPPTGFTSTGGFNGPFTVTSQTFSLTNNGTNSLTWTLANTSFWLHASSQRGTVTPGEPAATVTVSLNSAASNLVVGAYSATVWFTNLNDNLGQGRQFTLNVISPPTITTQPTNQMVIEGATAAFTIVATGGLPLSYQWQFNETNLVDGGNIIGSTTTNLIISPVSTNDAGAYTVVVTNLAGSTVSSNAQLTIISSRPIIIMQPSDESILVGRTASFYVGVIGTTPLSYQWSFNDTNITGATNNPLILSDVQLTNAGNYSVLITNLYGVTNSDSAVLTVTTCDPAPSGLVSWWRAENPTPTEDEVGGNNGTWMGSGTLNNYGTGMVGQAFVFDGIHRDRVDLGNPTNLQLQDFTIEVWIKRSSATIISLDENFQDGSLAGPGGFVFAYGGGGYSLGLRDDGSIGMSKVGVDIITVPPAVIDTNWHHIAVTKSGTNMMFYVDGVLQPNPTPSSYTNTFQFTTSAAIGSRGDAGGNTFYGMVDELSIYNRALSSNEIVAIYDAGSIGKCVSPVPPMILYQPQNQTNVVGSTVDFSVTARGTPPLFYQWNFNNTNIINATNSTLVLNNVQLTNTGNYSVVITNLYGSTNSAGAELTVIPLTCDSPPSGLVSWWQAEGDAMDAVGGNNGTLINNVGFTNGMVGSAFSFNGANYVTVPNAATLNPTNAITIEAWIYRKAVVGTWDPIVKKIDNSQINGYGLEFNGNNLLFWTYNNGWHNSGGTVPIALGQWYHVAGVYDGTQLLCYTNGVLASSSPTSGNINVSANSLNIANDPANSSSRFFNGLIDEVSIYRRALSADEIAAIYNAGDAGKCPPEIPPFIIIQPTNQTTLAGGTANFSMVAGGTSPLSYQWSFNNTNIANATNTTLVLNDVQLTNAGIYSVLITNLYGSTNSADALLTVTDILDHFAWIPIPSPRFINVPFAIAIQAQDPINLPFTNFTGVVNLKSTNGITVYPLVSSNFVQGAWTGSIIVSQVISNLTLQADDGFGHFGLANPINVFSLPSLTALPSGGTLYIYWPIDPSGFVLETTPTLSPPNWTNVAAPPFQIGNQNLEPIQMSSSNAFFRLRFPSP